MNKKMVLGLESEKPKIQMFGIKRIRDKFSELYLKLRPGPRRFSIRRFELLRRLKEPDSFKDKKDSLVKVT